MEDYQSNYTGEQVDSAVEKALNPDSSPTRGSTNFVTSGGVYNSIDALQTQVDNAGKVDDVKVNNVSVLDPLTKKASINITASVVANDTTGNPTATATMQDGNINIEFAHVKGIQGIQGRPGADFQPIQDVSGLSIAHDLGDSETSVMSQKGITAHLEGSPTTPVYTEVSGSYIAKDGTVKSFVGGRYTSPIEVHAGNIIKYTCDAGTNVASISKVLTEGSSYSPLLDDEGGYQERTLIAEEDMQVAFSYITVNHDDLTISIYSNGLIPKVAALENETSELSESIEGIEETIGDEVIDIEEGVGYTVTTGKYVNKNGGITNFSASRYTSPIDVHKGDVITYKAQGGSGNCATLSKVVHGGFSPLKYDANGYVVRTYAVEEDMQVVFSWIVTNISEVLTIQISRTKFESLSHKVSLLEKQIVEYNTSDGTPILGENPLARLISGPSRARIFAKYGVIGASFECGVENPEAGTSIYNNGYEWPTILGKVNGVEVYNHSLAGQPLNQWLTQRGNSHVTPQFPGHCVPWSQYPTPAECYIINMSTNDLTWDKYKGVAGDAEEIDLEHDYSEDPYDIYTPFTEVVTGVIQTCRKRSQNCFIMLATVRKFSLSGSSFRTAQETKDLCNAMKAVAELFENCFVIDMHEYGFDWSANGISYGYQSPVGIHPTRLGHIYLADAFNTYIDWIVDKNRAAFKDVSLILR